MSSEVTSEIESSSLGDTLAVARTLARKLTGGEVIILEGDLGAGKTAFVRGLADGIGSKDVVQSPSFTINRIYLGYRCQGSTLAIHHYDFHRLEDAGVLAEQLKESLSNPRVVTAIEWGDLVEDTLPASRLQIKIVPTSLNKRRFELKAIGREHHKLIKGLK